MSIIYYLRVLYRFESFVIFSIIGDITKNISQWFYSNLFLLNVKVKADKKGNLMIEYSRDISSRSAGPILVLFLKLGRVICNLYLKSQKKKKTDEQLFDFRWIKIANII